MQDDRTYYVEMKLDNGAWHPVLKLNDEGRAREVMQETQNILLHRDFQLVEVKTTRIVLDS